MIFDNESQRNRYNAGFKAGIAAAKKSESYHPWCAFDIIWAQGFKDALETYKCTPNRY